MFSFTQSDSRILLKNECTKKCDGNATRKNYNLHFFPFLDELCFVFHEMGTP